MNNHHFSNFLVLLRSNQTTPAGIHQYCMGVLHGFWCYAWMKDGVYYVGSVSKTLKSAKEDLYEEYKSLCERLNEPCLVNPDYTMSLPETPR